MILFAIFDGNAGGDWWSLYDEYSYLLGAPRLRDLYFMLGGVVMHKKLPERVPEVLRGEFYLYTLRWCEVTTPREEFTRLLTIRKAELLREAYNALVWGFGESYQFKHSEWYS